MDQRRARGQRNREALLRSALDLFATNGYEATTVEQISAAAGVAARTFFHHFATKDDILFDGYAGTCFANDGTIDPWIKVTCGVEQTTSDPVEKGTCVPGPAGYATRTCPRGPAGPDADLWATIQRATRPGWPCPGT